MRRQIGDRAVVLGASMAGLLAARVLADSYAQVTVIDRDELPETPMHRRGVPQGRHVHALLARGRQALEELFPGLTADLRCVTGARVRRRADGGAEQVLDADLVVDATGRGSRTPVWLQALGYPRPQQEQVRIGLGYATRTYRLPPDALGGDLGILHGATPEHPRGGALFVLEGGRWMLTLGGILGDYPPTDPDGFLAFARSLRFPDIYEAIRDGEPLDDPVGFRFPASVRRRYERLGRFPDGLLVVGDAVCSFNPIYGQGMSVAALQSLTLRRHLQRGVRPQPRRVFRDLARIVDVPWEIAVGGDLVFPGVQGRRTARVRLVNAYLGRLHAAAAHDARLAGAFLRVAGLVAPPESLLRPSIAVRVLRNGRHPAVGTGGRLQPPDAVRAAQTLVDSRGLHPDPLSLTSHRQPTWSTHLRR